MIKDTSFGEGEVYAASGASGTSGGCDCMYVACGCTTCDSRAITNEQNGLFLLTKTQGFS